MARSSCCGPLSCIASVRAPDSANQNVLRACGLECRIIDATRFIAVDYLASEAVDFDAADLCAGEKGRIVAHAVPCELYTTGIIRDSVPIDEVRGFFLIRLSGVA